MISELTSELLQVYTEAQLSKLAKLTSEVISRGHGEITIVIKNNKPRFISMKTSEEFMFCEPALPLEFNGGAP